MNEERVDCSNCLRWNWLNDSPVGNRAVEPSSAVAIENKDVFCLSWTLSFESVLEFSTTLPETFDVEAQVFYA